VNLYITRHNELSLTQLRKLKEKSGSLSFLVFSLQHNKVRTTIQ